jgi:hypothetical protein
MIAKREAAEGAQQSIRHHYIPVFYSKRWSGDDDRICEFSRPYKKIHSQRVYPKQTGFLDRLYEKKGVPKSIAQHVEDVFMKSVDNFAANALSLIETDVEKVKNDAEQRSAWSLFLITLMTRMPEDLTDANRYARRSASSECCGGPAPRWPRPKRCSPDWGRRSTPSSKKEPPCSGTRRCFSSKKTDDSSAHSFREGIP